MVSLSRTVIKQLEALTADQASFGVRKVIFSSEDSLTSGLQGLTYGVLYPNCKIDWHCHPDKDEFFLVQKGRALIHFEDGSSERIAAGACVYLKPGTKHYLENDGEEDFEAYFLRIYSTR